ncbi:MOT6-like protein [Mya arenaria]|uniref:MOT6-like protein n=1 Tax=Mya arenaria TaxID=6604 RepID=A0ABY7F710_MYAAR|nr:monocarboxylate transporter 13-like [Mya arenaria]WAR17159.1 MOT6-like protein [Mya arenaria]
MTVFVRPEASYHNFEREKLLSYKGSEAIENGYGTKEAPPLCVKHTSRSRKASVMLACLVQQFVCIGMGFGFSVMFAELVPALGVTRSVASLLEAAYFCAVSVGGIFFTSIIRKVGPGRSIILGSTVGSIGIFASGFSPNITGIIILSGVLAGLGMSICFLSGYVAVSWIFQDNASLALAALTIGSSVGQFAFPLLFEVTLAEYTWRGSFMVMAGFPLQCIVCGVVVYGSREYFVTGEQVAAQTNTAEMKGVNHPSRNAYGTLLMDGVVILVLFNFFLLSLTGNCEAWFIVDMLMSRGMTREAGSVAASAIGLANVMGRLAATVTRYKLPNIPTIYHWVYICPLTAITHVLVVNVYQYVSIVGVCIVYGILYGITVAQGPSIMFDVAGLQRYPQGMALINVMYGVGDALSAVLGGYVKDTTGSYGLVFYIAAGASVYTGVSSFICAYFVRKRIVNKPKGAITVKRETRERLISSTMIHP